MVEARPQPRVWRLILAFFAAPWPIAAVYAWWAASLGGKFSVPTAEGYFVISSLVAYLPILLLGVPLHFILRHRTKPRLAWMALSGAIIAVAMSLVLVPFVMHRASLTAGPVAVQVDLPPGGGGGASIGSPIAGFVMAIFSISLVGGLGGIGGFTFWLVAVFGDRRLNPAMQS
jgi:hypothetical protein